MDYDWVIIIEKGDELPVLSPKQARVLHDFSQQDIAEMLGVHKDTYRKWEKNPELMPMGMAEKFAKAVERGIDEIFFKNKSTLS